MFSGIGGRSTSKEQLDGFGTTDNPPLVAMYSERLAPAERARGIQAQSLAYSPGPAAETWTKYSGNPVIDNRPSRDFRDPKVFWYEQGPGRGAGRVEAPAQDGGPRATRANVLGALLALLLGAGIAAQVQLTNQRGLDELSQTDLVRVLDDISLRSSRLDQQVRELESTRDRLKNGTGTAAEALQQAQKRVDTLGILAGTVAAKGPGITMRITDPTNAVTGPIVLDIIQELRDAGAESIDVGGVRVVASSFVGDRNGQIQIDGATVPRPLVIKVIGDSKTLSSAMTIPGGIVESVRQKGAEAAVTESSLIEITSLHQPTKMTHAKPVE